MTWLMLFAELVFPSSGAFTQHRPFRRPADSSLTPLRQLEFGSNKDYQTKKRGKMRAIIHTFAPAVLYIVSGIVLNVGAFSPHGQTIQRQFQQYQVRTSTAIGAADQNEDVVLYSDEWEDGVPPPPSAAKNKNRWNALSPAVKAKIVKEAQQRAIRNKKKNESSSDKKRRLMFYMKDMQRKKKRDSRIDRVKSFDERTPLSELTVGDIVDGKVISLTRFGVYIDIGTECDGLLHISQISKTDFIEHPRQVFSPGDEVTVRISRFSPEQKKLQLTMLPVEDEAEDDPDDVSDEDAIPLEEIAVDDELWGEIKRVTAYGGYVELGAEVDGWLHFMDHPEFGSVAGASPSEYMHVGDRVRVWASDVDLDRKRLKLTAKRPPGLPGPRREMVRR